MKKIPLAILILSPAILALVLCGCPPSDHGAHSAVDANAAP